MATRKSKVKYLVWQVEYQQEGEPAVAIRNTLGHFLADPFVVNQYIFCEDYSYVYRKGAIRCFKIEDGRHKDLGIVLSEPFHLSFPYVFSVGGEYYMLPETHKANEIRLYKATNFPTGWVYYKTLMTANAADSLLFYRKGKWYLLTNIGNHNDRLYLFSSNSFDSDKWNPVGDGPVVKGFNARNGGLVQLGYSPIRIAQHQGKVYGESYGAYEIVEISPTSYEEKLLYIVKPREGMDATHHFSSSPHMSAWDSAKLL